MAITLQSLVGQSRILICVGKGGVGKTTVAAALGLSAANQGQKVACLTIDPARRLADGLGLGAAKVGNQLVDISDAVGVKGSGTLSVGMLDAVSAFEQLLFHKVSDGQANRVRKNPLFQFLKGSLTGLQEYMAFEWVCRLVAQGGHDLVVLDTPPAVNVIDFFKAPTRMVDVLDGKVVHAVAKMASRGSRSRFGRSWSVSIFHLMRKITGDLLFSEMMSLLDALRGGFGHFRKQAIQMRHLLGQEQTMALFVTTPGTTSFEETRWLEGAIAQGGIGKVGVVFNRTHCPRIETGIPDWVEPEQQLVMARQNRLWNEQLDKEQQEICRFQKQWAAWPMWRFPLLPIDLPRTTLLELLVLNAEPV